MSGLSSSESRKLIEAYSSVYNQSQKQEVISEDLQKTVGQALDAAAKNPVIRAIGKVIEPSKGNAGRGTVTKAEQEKRVQQNQSVDLFDLVKGHLIDEGYADTEEAALVIMANMSEEWKQSIIEGVGGYNDPFLGPQTPLGRAVRTGYKVAKGAVTGAIQGAQGALQSPATVKSKPDDSRLVNVSTPEGQAAIAKQREIGKLQRAGK